MKTNITMLVRNRLRLTRQSLESLWAYTPLDAWNLTIIDDRSDEPAARLLSTYGAMRNDVPMGTGSLRNAVIAESERRHGREDFLYLSDNDIVASPYWLETLIQCYQDVWSRGFRILGGCNHPYNQPIGEMQFIHNDPDHRVYEVNHLASQSILMTWDVWDQFGKFVDTPVDAVCQSEDIVFSNQIREAGYKVGVVSPWVIANVGITNSFGDRIPGWELVKSQAPPGVIVE